MESMLVIPDATRLRFSGFVNPFERDGTIALYHSINNQVVFGSKDEYMAIKQKLESGIAFDEKELLRIKSMIDSSFIVPFDYNESEILDSIRTRSIGRPSFDVLYLLLSDLCNIRCKYCFIENAMPEDRLFSMMSEETAIKAIHFFAGMLAKNPMHHEKPMIFFYGGEPFLNKSVLISAAKEISRLKQNGELPSATQMTVITNATLVDYESIEVMATHKIRASVSLDGKKEFHDANRIYKDGQGTFDKASSAIKRMQAAGIHVSISCTITKENIDQIDEMLIWFYEEFGIQDLGFNMLLDLPTCEQADEEYAKKVTEKLVTCFAIEREKGIYEDRIMRKVKSFVTGRLYLKDCEACGFQLVIAPDGKIGPCQALLSSGKYFTGDVNDPNYDPFCDPTFIEWSKRSPFNLESCQGCHAIGICGGGCSYNAWLKTGSIWEIDRKFCIHTKYILYWLLWELQNQLCSRQSKRSSKNVRI